MRRLEVHPVGEMNSLVYWTRIVPFWRVARNVAVIYLCRFIPWLGVKNALYRMLGMRVGRHVSVGLGAIFDVFWPQLISIGDNSIIGFNSTILAHEFLIREWRTGPVLIGRNVMIGANSTVLAGVRIGDGASVSAMSLVNRDVPPDARVMGVPAVEMSREPAAEGGVEG